MTKRKQYVDDWDYGISGSDDERKTPEAKAGAKSKGQVKEEQANQPPVCDPKDPAAAYFFLVSTILGGLWIVLVSSSEFNIRDGANFLCALIFNVNFRIIRRQKIAILWREY